MTGLDGRGRLGAGIGQGREIHIWCASSDAEPGRLGEFWCTLSDDERNRAGRFHFARDRQRYIARRGRLRAILAGYLGQEPPALRFAYGPFGKPALASVGGGPTLEFNLSHSSGLVLLAVAGHSGVGIDVERIDAAVNYHGVAASFFSPAEVEEIGGAPLACARRTFFRLWSRHEAVGKARGDGLAVLDEARRGAVTAGGAGLMGGCSATEIDVGQEYAAAVALNGRWQMRSRRWRERVMDWEACYSVELEAC